ncbi:MAG: hypothetical protein MMC23_008354 [Stictis urceolatum]|nr:hypothetical protein [Stictis urceolata]
MQPFDTELPGLVFLKANAPVSAGAIAIYTLLLFCCAYYLLHYTDRYPILSPSELLWNLLVYVTPPTLVLAFDRSKESALKDNAEGKDAFAISRSFAAKSQALRRIMGLDGTGALTSIQRTRSLSGLGFIFKSSPPTALAGLGNWDNSCYQNSVLQGLSSLPSLYDYLAQTPPTKDEGGLLATKDALKDLVEDLNSTKNLGQKIWTPPALKNMSSWQQQDAQEYYSRIVDELEKEIGKTVSSKLVHQQLGLKYIGLGALEDVKRPPAQKASKGAELEASAPELSDVQFDTPPAMLRTPLEGLLAQRVGCLKCGFVEGLSLIPFNCLTVPLGRQFSYKLEGCLDDYTALEPINGVECAKCTLSRSKEELELLLEAKQPPPGDGNGSKHKISGLVREATEERLRAVETALFSEDFAESTLAKKCMISSKNRVSTTKSRQAVIARAPRDLVIHVNRSIFDEYSGMLSKNYSDVQFPKVLDLSSWCLGGPTRPGTTEEWNTDPSRSMLSDPLDILDRESNVPHHPLNYRLRAIVTHYGRHENGHYIAYRQTPYHATSESIEGPEAQWWRLSDEDVSAVSEENVLSQGGVFMLFYERTDELPDQGSDAVVEPAAETTGNPASSSVRRQTGAAEIRDSGKEAAHHVPEPRDEADSNGVVISPIDHDLSYVNVPGLLNPAADHPELPPPTSTSADFLESPPNPEMASRQSQARLEEVRDALGTAKRNEPAQNSQSAQEEASGMSTVNVEREIHFQVPRMRTSSAAKAGTEALGRLGKSAGCVQAI